MKNLLLHVCCGPCSTQAIETLIKDFKITVLYFNPNINPKEEYSKRLIEAKKVAKIYNLKLISLEYDHAKWLNAVKGLETEKENGNRCEECFRFRLKKTKELAENFDYFTTSLTVSPFKDSNKINKIGQEFKEKYLTCNFKDNDGYKKSIELSKRYNLYRQKYCGCEFSLA